MNFKANWICRGGNAERIVPNDAVVISALGPPKLVWFKMLKNSDRNWTAIPSRAGMRNRLLTPISHCQKLGPVNALRPTLPNGATDVGMPKAALFQYWSIMETPLGRVGSPTRFGRCVATPRHSASRPVASSAAEGV